MLRSNNQICIVGSDLAGLTAALRLCSRGLGRRVILLESEAALGRSLQSTTYPNGCCFDRGFRMLRETGNDALDDLLFSVLDDEEWKVFGGTDRDLAGLFWNDQYFPDSPYLDIRALPEPLYAACIEPFISAIRSDKTPDCSSALHFARCWYGNEIAERLVAPILEHWFGKSAADLDPAILAVHKRPLGRIVLFDHEQTEDVIDNPALRERLAFPDQRELPEHCCSPYNYLYPKQGGMQRFVDAVSARLRREGVEIVCNAQVTGIECSGESAPKVQTLRCEVDGEPQQFEPSQLIWTDGLPALAKHLGLKRPLQFDASPQLVLGHAVLSVPAQAADNYSIMCADRNLHTFRVTAYQNFCAALIRNGKFPVTLEMLFQNGLPASDEQLQQLVRREICALGLTDSADEIEWVATEHPPSEFPMLTLRNAASLQELREYVRLKSLTNLVVVGALTQPDVLDGSEVAQNVAAQI